jgi:hypothetical protein
LQSFKNEFFLFDYLQVTNPQRLVKGESGGVFARLKIKGLKDEDASKPFVHRVHAEIVRI